MVACLCHPLAMAAMTLSLDALPSWVDGGQHTQQGDDQGETTRVGIGTTDSVTPWRRRALTSARPKNVPSASPSSAPKSATIAASQRIIERTCVRDIPTARSRPIAVYAARQAERHDRR